MKTQVCVSLIAIYFASGCATVRSANIAKPIETTSQEKEKVAAREHERKTKAGLIISGEEIGELSSRNIGMVTITFENTTDRWLELEGLGVSFGDTQTDKAVHLVMGPHLTAWAKAAAQKRAISRYNTRIALGVLAAAMAVTSSVAAAANSRVGNVLGNTGLIATLTAATIYEVDARLTELRQARLLPDDHLLSGAIIVPPGMFARKYLVLSTSGSKVGYLDRLFIRYRTGEGDEKVELVFRKRPSRWQRELAPPELEIDTP